MRRAAAEGAAACPSPTLAGRALEAVLVVCILLFLAVTAFATLFVTAYLPDYDYSVVFSYSTAPAVLIGIALFVAILALADRMGLLERIGDRRLAVAVVVYALLLGVIWALAAHVWPDWDSLNLVTAGQELGRRGSIFYEHGGYLYRFPYQMGYVLLIRLVSTLALGHTYLALEAVNIVCTAWIFYLVIAIAREVFTSRRAVSICCILCLLFLPLIFYVTFAYAIAIGLAFALLGMLLQMRAIFRGSRRLALASGAAICAGCIFKSNMLVALAAMAAVWLCHLIRCPRRASAWGLALLVGVYVLGSLSISLLTRAITGMSTDHGIPTSVTVSMGLSDTDGENYGWYNGLPWRYGPEEYDVERYDREARALIAAQIKRFAADPAYAWTFFSKKYCSEWCMPTYESLLASNWRFSSKPEVPVMAERDHTPLAEIIYYGPVHDGLVSVLDALQTLILVGALVAVIGGRFGRGRPRGASPADAAPPARRACLRVQHMAPLLFATGSALFYLVWEAQAQYVMPAYVALVPFAAGGIATALDGIGRRIGPQTTKAEDE